MGKSIKVRIKREGEDEKNITGIYAGLTVTCEGLFLQLRQIRGKHLQISLFVAEQVCSLNWPYTNVKDDIQLLPWSERTSN